MMIYLKYTDANGVMSIQGHNVWDRDRFVAARKEEWTKLGGKAEQVITETYRKHAWGKHEPT